MEGIDTIEDYVEGLRERFPDIKAYGEDDWDWSWADEGYGYLEACDFGMAELMFQRVVVSRPNDLDGYEGLALVYQALELREPALMMIKEAVRLAQQELVEERIDPEVIAELEAEQTRILALPVMKPASSEGGLG